MSYDIIYDKQFVRANDKYFPIVLCGSNNCYEVGRNGRDGRRTREWYNMIYMTVDYKPYATREEILARIEEIRAEKIQKNKEDNEIRRAEGRLDWIEEYDDARFGYWTSIALSGKHCGSTSFAAYKGIFTAGMQKAMTVEELLAENIRLHFFTYKWGKETEEKAKEKGIELLDTVFPTTTEQLLAEADRWYNHYKDTGFSWYITFTQSGEYFEEKIRKIRMKRFPKKKKEYTTKLIHGFYTIYAPNGGYFCKATRSGYQYSYSTPIRRFETTKQAQSFVNKMKSRIELKVGFVNEDTKIRVPA